MCCRTAADRDTGGLTDTARPASQSRSAADRNAVAVQAGVLTADAGTQQQSPAPDARQPTTAVFDTSMQAEADLVSPDTQTTEDRLQLPSQQRRSADAASQAAAAVLAAAATQADGARTETQQQTEQPHSSCSLPESLVEATLVELEGRAAR